ncbi:hypothetical protein EJ110_NYTH02641 [Nymphaea thermarum]|nr:hypothetical protein EJ110_NYTH02641 [Nymphaea thermarum]
MGRKCNNSRVLYNAFDHPTNPFVVLEGKYYLDDGGYPNIVGSLTPYQGHRYHMFEFNTLGARTPRTPKELSNHRHSSLQNYPFKKKVQIVIATYVLHNFIIEHNPNDEQFVDKDAPLSDNFVLSKLKITSLTHQQGSNNSMRIAITTQMFTDYQLNSKFIYLIRLLLHLVV